MTTTVAPGSFKEFLLVFITRGGQYSSTKTFNTLASIAILVLFVRHCWVTSTLDPYLLLTIGAFFITNKAFSAYNDIKVATAKEFTSPAARYGGTFSSATETSHGASTED